METWPSLMASSSANRGQEACPQSQAAFAQHLSDDKRKATPAHIPSAARRRLFGLQRRCHNAQGYYFLHSSPQCIYGTV